MTAFTLDEAERELCRRSLKHFARRLWPLVEPTTPLEWGWPHDAICDHLEALSRGLISKLVINVPPKFLKSTLCSVLWPAWEWLERPELRFLTTSYDKDLASRDAQRSRTIMRSAEYRELVRASRAWRFSGDQDVKTRYENDRSGTRISSSVNSGVTGHNAGITTIDDPHSAEDAYNEEALRAVCRWWDETFMSRVSDQRYARRMVIAQRVSKNDLSGHILEQGGACHLCLPLLHDSDHPYACKPNALGFKDPRTVEGEPLIPARYPPDVIAVLRLAGVNAFAAQYQQNPHPPGGTIFQAPWFGRWRGSLPGRWDSVLISADLAFKGTDKQQAKAVEDLSFVVFDAWGFIGGKAWLIAQDRKQSGFSESCRRFVAFCREHPTILRKLVEDKANGPALVDILKGEVPGLEEVEPQGSKIQRAYAIQPYAEQGNILVPEGAPWLNGPKGWIEEVCNFPFKRHDDRVDTMTQGITHSRVLNASSVIERMRNLLRA